MKNIFITGITGLLGTNLANELLDAGYYVTALARNPKKYFGKRTEHLKLIKNDLFDDYSAYLKDIDVVVHIAAVTATNLLEYTAYERINYLATIKLLEQAKGHKVSRFIFISSANTIGFGSLEDPGTEDNKIREPFSKHFYAQSKLQAERYLLEQKGEMELIILNPTFMIGANDSKPSSGKLLLMGLDKRIVFYAPGGKSFVPVKDVVTAIISSFTKGKSHEKYLIAGENLTYKEFFRKLKDITQQSQILIPIPKAPLLLLGIIGNLMRFFKIKTSLSLDNMKSLCINNYYSNQKSKDDLGITSTSLENAIKESVDYFRVVKKI